MRQRDKDVRCDSATLAVKEAEPVDTSMVDAMLKEENTATEPAERTEMARGREYKLGALGAGREGSRRSAAHGERCCLILFGWGRLARSSS